MRVNERSGKPVMNELNEMSVESGKSAPAENVRMYLRSVRDAHRRAEALCARAEKYRELLLRASSCPGDGIRSARHDRQEDHLLRLTDTHAELKKEIHCLLDLSREAEKLILLLPDERHRGVLQLRYLCAMEWEEVAERLKYTLRWAHKLHREGLAQLEEILEGKGIKEDIERHLFS